MRLRKSSQVCRALRLAGWLLALLCVAMVGARPASAGAWPQTEGQGLIIVTGAFDVSDRMFDAHGKLQPVAGYRKFTLKSWLEYGIDERLTLIFAPEASRLSSGVGDNVSGGVEAGLRYRLLMFDGHVLSAQATVRPATRLDGVALPWARKDVTEFDARLIYGRSFALAAMPAFIETQAGARVRLNAPDELRLDATIGLRPMPRLLVLAQLFNLFAQADALNRASRQHKAQLSIVYDLDARWSAQAGVYRAFAGSRSRRETGGLAGLWRRF